MHCDETSMVDKKLKFSVSKMTQMLVAIIGVFLLCGPLFSQDSQGRILGTITDQTGGVVAGATVTVLDVQRGVSRTLTTDQAGEYNAPNLTPGIYRVRAEAKGFAAIERPNISLEVGTEVRVDLTLSPGAQTQTMTVTEELPELETTTATLGGTLSNETINDIPLNGRNYIYLIPLRPGVMVYPGAGGGDRSANGSRSEDFGYLLDGMRNDEPYTGESVLNAPIAAGDATTALPIDAIQEFNTEENPKAEFGWKPGVIINAGLKSGTNNLHGTAFAFGRDAAWDARDFFDPPPLPKAPIALQQFGASLGGAIQKDKLFYFVDYEGQRYSVGSTFVTAAPSTVSLGGTNVTQSIVDACNAIGRGSVTPLSAQLAGLPSGSCVPAPTNYTPGPSESLFPANTGDGPVVLGLVSTNQQDNGVAKLDYHINEKNTLSGMYFQGAGGGLWNDQPYQAGIPGTNSSPWMSNLHGYTNVGSAAWTWVPDSSWANEFRAGYNRNYQPYYTTDHDVNPLAYGINTGVTDPSFFGFPFIRINPFTLRLGGNWPKVRGPDGSLELLDHVSFLRGKHAFKMGGEIIYNTSSPFVTANAKGDIRFKNLEDFLEGDVKNSGTLSAILVGNPLRHYSDEQYAAFLQDDWRLTPRLTLNLGVRYELTTVLKDESNQLGNFDPNSTEGLVQVGSGETSAYEGDHNNFSPRLGLAWDVRGNGKTVIRAAGSVMYEQLPFNVFTEVDNQLGLNEVPTGATYITCPAACQISGIPVTTKGVGNMGVLTVSVPGGPLSTGWQNQTSACVTGGTTACGSIFPASIFNLECGDGLPDAGIAGGVDPSPCASEAVDPHLRTPYVGTWHVDIQRAITNTLSLDVAYVGTHAAKLLGFRDLNQPPAGSGFPAGEIAFCNSTIAFLSNEQPDPSAPFACDAGDASPALEQAARPFTANGKFGYLGEIDQLSNLDHSNYNGLQVTLTQRAYHGLSFVAGYTYSHALDEASSNSNANPLPPSSANPGLQYGSSDFDIRHRFTFTATYNLPKRKSPGQLLEGWSVNSIVTLQSGLPWTPEDMSNDFSGTGQVNELDSFGQIWDFTGNPADFRSGPNPIPCWAGSGGAALSGCTITTIAPPAACTNAAATVGEMNALLDVGCYVQGKSVLLPPPVGSVGTLGRNVFRDSGFKDWDFSVTKIWTFKERLTAQFRAEFFNILNHPIFYNPNGPAGAGFNDPSTGQSGDFGCGCETPASAAPNPVLGTGENRTVQLGLKLIF
jgi:hypothetical protein